MTTAQPTQISGSLIGGAQFREIHKNTWLKRLNAEGKKITVGPKKSERNWVVFCVHDDTEALLEGYAEPRQAASHNPEWVVSMQHTLHISHSIIPNSNEFEFVVTLSNEVIRFHAFSWEIMQEWVETLRSKLREMKILSPRENLYTKLPEARPILLPTRDPTSPLPLPPPVPAEIVPGVEIVVPPSLLQTSANPTTAVNTTSDTTRNNLDSNTISSANSSSTALIVSSSAATTTPSRLTTTLATAMSNTSAQNLLNMLSDPISAYSEQLQATASTSNDSSPISIGSEQLSSSLNDIHINGANSNEDCLSPLLRTASTAISYSKKRISADEINNLERTVQCDQLIPRPHTSRSRSVGAADKTKSSRITKTNITALEITTTESLDPATSRTLFTQNNSGGDENNKNTNITIIQVSNDSNSIRNLQSNGDETHLTLNSNSTAEIFTFTETVDNELPKSSTPTTRKKLCPKLPEYKSNVQLIPSNSKVNSSTIKVLGDTNFSASAISNQYSTPNKKMIKPQPNESTTQNGSNKVTTLHVGGVASVTVYGTCFTTPQQSSSPLTTSSTSTSATLTPKLPKKIILSANTSGITNITVDSNVENGKPQVDNPNNSVRCNMGAVHYEKVFLSSSTPIVTTTTTSNISTRNDVSITTSTAAEPATTPVLNATPALNATPPKSPKSAENLLSPRRNKQETKAHITSNAVSSLATTSTPTATATASYSATSKKTNITVQAITDSSSDIPQTLTPVRVSGSPAMQRRILRPTNMLLTRGLTEAVITTRPSRRDFHINNTSLNTNSQNTPTRAIKKSGNKSQITAAAANNNDNGDSTTDLFEQRRRSSSTSDARAQRSTRGANNNELAMAVRTTAAAFHIQQPPLPFRNMEGSLLGPAGVIGFNSGMSPPPTGASASKRLTLREQQVMQLRREIMHPGGVRLQLRRKDCIGSIAWVDAFGAVWIAGWKQKEHPVLYNALHIGDQLLSIAGVSISSAAEANKIIRNANTLFVEMLVLRIPFGRGYAIRRDREGQCLGLIRDGNTATIVDVVPNSLAARHGLPPKAKSCDGSSLTFWMLTEINGRPLNLFFKENEIRDRLNSVGRDISILVQPSDLILKLKKQLKSFRGYKDYLVQ